MRYAFTGGGTGGHAYPSLAVAERVMRQPDAELAYYGSARGPERLLAQQAGITFRAIPAAQMRGRSPVRLLNGAYNLWRGTRATARWFAYEPPAAVFATGGYVAAPVGRAAAQRGIPLLVFLPDVYPGWAVRFLQRYATRFACSVDDSLAHLPAGRTVVTGYPLRPQFAEATREGGIERFELDPQLPTVLITGGSLGAHHINLVVAGALRRLLERTQIIHICGTGEEAWLQREREQLPEWLRTRYHLHGYTDQIAWAMAAADVAVTRAGASTLGELPATGLPAIVVPGPFSDQERNASYLESRGAAVVLHTNQLDDLERMLLRLLDNDAERERIRAALHALARPDAAQHLADMLQEVAA